MIVFGKLKYKNFLSTGDQFTEIDLAANSSTLVVGQNGAGKSTMLDALSFALFGRAHRNVNKPQLVNTVNGKDCVVEINFRALGQQYVVIRGLKPARFEIWQGERLLNQDSHAKEYQKILEQNILKLNHKSFHQVVVLGSSSFIPFMQLSAQHRREVIEDLLDINVFSKMNTLLKEKISIFKDNIRENEYALELNSSKIETQQAHITELEKISESAKNKSKSELTEQQTELARLNTQVTSWEDSVLSDLQTRQSALDTKINEMGKYVFQFNSKQKASNKEIKFYEDNEDCPTCEQAIESSFRLDKVQNAKNKWDELEEARQQCEHQIGKLTNDKQNIQSSIDTEVEQRNQINTIKEKITWTQKRITSLQDELSELETGVHSLQEAQLALDELQKIREQIVQKKMDLAEEREYNNVVTELLKDSGIKTKIIKQYLPVINRLTNQHLQVLDFYVHFDLDEAFNETIRSRHRDAFSYSSFSEGEKQRIDLALLFTWRHVARMKNSVATNLLVLDETFDSSLDADGVENLLKILDTLDKDTNIFIISHKGELLDNKFNNKIEFIKSKNFSKIA